MKTLVAALTLTVWTTAQANNPIISAWFTPDPAPYVHGDTVYLFTDHDEDDAQYFKMKDWQLYSSTDMVNWTFRGIPLSTETFSWAKQGDNAWASQAIERDGKWYWYVAAEDESKGLHGIGVAVAEKPEGPYRDAIGKPLIPGEWGYIDPSVFVDDDGQAYLFWGNNGLWYVKLGNDMVSTSGDIIKVDVDDEKAFGPKVMKYDWKINKEHLMTGYEEGPWLYKRDGIYYLEYAAGGVPEHLAYSTAESIDGPWTYRGRIMDEAEGSFTIHGGSIELKGRHFMFYHDGRMTNGGGFRRATCIEEYDLNADGSIPFIPFTEEGVKTPLQNLYPYSRVEAETMSEAHGVKTDRNAGKDHWLTRIYNGSWTRLRSVDFGAGVSKIKARVRGKAGGVIEFLSDGKTISKIEVDSNTEWTTVEADAKGLTGVHDVTILFRGGDEELLEFDWWKAEKSAYAIYRNPIIYADVPDMSLCRVGDYYYLISTTMHLMPGGPIMRSADMENWETISYVFPRIDDGPRYSLLCDSTAYGQGQWASSIRYHNGKFYVWFSANGAPGRGFIYTADDAVGPWTLLSRPPHFHDGSLFFDDDGRVYIFHGTGCLTELRPDLTDKLEGGVDMTIFKRDPDEQGLLEGSSAFKHNGKYYLMMISMDWEIPGRLRREVCYRADSITGPYEKRVILETEFEGYGGVGQGCVVEGKDSEWYALIFQDRVGVGRVPCLMPCRWTDDGWPMLGDDNGNIPNDPDLPYMSLTGICGSDNFDSPDLSLYWQWNHNPIDEAWSLTANPGCLRLQTARVVDNLYLAPNTLTQRMSGPECSGEICLYVGGMKDGDRAGLSAFSSDSGVMTVEQENGKRRLVVTEQNSVFHEPEHGIERVDTKELFSVEFSQDLIYLRVNGNFKSDHASFEYSFDGREWISVGRPVKMTYDYQRVFMGARFAIFNYATKEIGGFVDVKSFKYDFKQ